MSAFVHYFTLYQSLANILVIFLKIGKNRITKCQKVCSIFLYLNIKIGLKKWVICNAGFKTETFMPDLKIWHVNTQTLKKLNVL